MCRHLAVVEPGFEAAGEFRRGFRLGFRREVVIRDAFVPNRSVGDDRVGRFYRALERPTSADDTEDFSPRRDEVLGDGARRWRTDTEPADDTDRLVDGVDLEIPDERYRVARYVP